MGGDGRHRMNRPACHFKNTCFQFLFLVKGEFPDLKPGRFKSETRERPRFYREDEYDWALPIMLGLSRGVAKERTHVQREAEHL